MIKNMIIVNMVLLVIIGAVLVKFEISALKNWQTMRKTNRSFKLFTKRQFIAFILIALVFSFIASAATAAIVKLCEMPDYERIGTILFVVTRCLGILELLALVLVVKNVATKSQKE